MDVSGDLVNGAVLILEDSDFAFWAAVVMCLSVVSFAVSLYLHRWIDERRLEELEEKYEELSDLDKYRYSSEAWYYQVKDQRYFGFHRLNVLEAKVDMAVSFLEDVPSATLNLYMLYHGGVAGGTQVLVALLSVCGFANMLYETYDRFADAQEPAPLTLKGHTKPVRSAAPFPDGRRLVTASFDKTAKVWDVETGAALVTLEGHTDWVLSAAVSPDGHAVLTAGADEKVIRHERL